jgi:hypothetical protein
MEEKGEQDVARDENRWLGGDGLVRKEMVGRR